MRTDARLDTRFLVGTENKVLIGQRRAVPVPGIEIEDAARLGGEVGITRKDPRTVLPGADGVVVQPAPDRLVTDSRDNAVTLNLPHDVGRAQTRERYAERRGQFTRQRLDLDDDLWGEKLGGDPSGSAPRVQPDVSRRSACARG